MGCSRSGALETSDGGLLNCLTETWSLVPRPRYDAPGRRELPAVRGGMGAHNRKENTFHRNEHEHTRPVDNIIGPNKHAQKRLIYVSLGAPPSWRRDTRSRRRRTKREEARPLYFFFMTIFFSTGEDVFFITDFFFITDCPFLAPHSR